MPVGTILIPNPRSPKDREGKRIRDLGSEITSHDTNDASGNGHRAPSAKRSMKVNVPKAKSLQSLVEIDEDVQVEKPNIRARLASQKSKDEEKSDAELKLTIQNDDTKSHAKTSIKNTPRTTITDIQNSTTSVNDTRHTLSASEARKSMTLIDDTRFATISSDNVHNTFRGNLSQSTQSLYSSTERYKTRSERLMELSMANSDNLTTDNRLEKFENSSNNTDKPGSTAFRSERVFGERKAINDNESSASTYDDSDEKSNEIRRPSFLKTLKNAASRNKKRPPSIYEEITKHDENKTKRSHLYPEFKENVRKSSDHLIYTNAELIKMAREDLENKGKRIEESVTPTLKKKSSTSSSFHQYNPDKRVPLKERLKNKMSETSTSTDEDDRLAIPSTTPLVQRASRLTRDKSTDKDDSLRSRFLRRFRLGSEEKSEEKKETHEKITRKKTENSQEDNSTISPRKHKKESDGDKTGENIKRENESIYDVKDDPSNYDVYTTRGMKLSMDHRMTSIDIDMENKYKTGTSLSEILAKEEKKSGVDMSKYRPYSFRSRHKLKELEGEGKSPKYDRQTSGDSLSEKRSKTHSVKDENDCDKHSPRSKNKKLEDTDDETHKNRRRSRGKGKEEGESTIKTDTDSIMPVRERDGNTLKEPKSEFQRDDMPSPKGVLRRLHHTYSFDKKENKCKNNLRKKNKTEKVDDKAGDIETLDILHRKSLYVYEEEIKPVVKSEDIQLHFKSPRASLSEEVIEEVIVSSIIDRPIEDDFFKSLLQREVSEEEVNFIGTEEEEVTIDDLFEKIDKLPSDSNRTSIISIDPNGREYASLSCELSDEMGEYNNVFTNSNRSSDSSSGDLFAKIEKANNKLYSGLLRLTNNIKDTGEESDQTVQESDGSSNYEKKDKVENVNILSEVPEVVAEDGMEVNSEIYLNGKNVSKESVETTESMSPNEWINIAELPSSEDTMKSKDSGVCKHTSTESEVIEMKYPMEINLSHENIHRECEGKVDKHIKSEMACEEKIEPSPFKLATSKKGYYLDDDNMSRRSLTSSIKDDIVSLAKYSGEVGKDITAENEPMNIDHGSVVDTRKTKEVLNTMEDNNSFDKAVDEAAQDVNKMLSNCNSIDKINDEIQRIHPPITSEESTNGSDVKSSEDVSVDIHDRSQNASPAKKRLSYLQKRASHMKFFQNELSVSNEDIPVINDRGIATNESSNNNGSLSEGHDTQLNVNEADKQKTIESTISTDPTTKKVGFPDLLNPGILREQVKSTEKKACNSSEESALLGEIIDNIEVEMALEDLKNEKPEEKEEITMMQHKQEEEIPLAKHNKTENVELEENEKCETKIESANLNKRLSIDISKDNNVVIPDQSENTAIRQQAVLDVGEIIEESHANRKGNKNNIEDEAHDVENVPKSIENKKRTALTSSKSFEEHTNASLKELKISNSAKMAAIRSTQSVDIKSLEEIRSRLDKIKSKSIAPSLVNANVIVDSKPPVDLKSLDEIKNRLSEIKARKKQLKLLEITKHMPIEMDINPEGKDSSILPARKIELSNDFVESGAENEKMIIKLSNDFLEDSTICKQNEQGNIENGDIVLENGIFDDGENEKVEASCDKFMEENNKNEKLKLDQMKTVCKTINLNTNDPNADSKSLNGFPIQHVKASLEDIINIIADNNNITNEKLTITESEVGMKTKEGFRNNEKSECQTSADNNENVSVKNESNNLIEKTSENEGILIKEDKGLCRSQSILKKSNEDETELSLELQMQVTSKLSLNEVEKSNNLLILNERNEVYAVHLSNKLENDELNAYPHTNDSKEILNVDMEKSEKNSTPSLFNEHMSDGSTSTTSSETCTTTKATVTIGHQKENPTVPKVSKFVFPRQMSIVEYRRQKLENHHSETSNQSDDENPLTKSDDNLKEHKSSVADVSDASDDCRERRKFYRHNKKDIKTLGENLNSSASEDNEEDDAFIVDLLANRYMQRTIGSQFANDKPPKLHTTDTSNRSDDPSNNQKVNERYKTNGNV